MFNLTLWIDPGAGIQMGFARQPVVVPLHAGLCRGRFRLGALHVTKSGRYWTRTSDPVRVKHVL